jgi:hypothetical protein
MPSDGLVRFQVLNYYHKPVWFGGIGDLERLPSPETVLALAIFAVALWRGHGGCRWMGWWERPLARLARRKWLAILVAGVSPLVLRAVLLPWYGVPEPRVQDEFSFLLAADTFAHGRLVNPQHPFWMHFESEHILARPVYASAFPIAQAGVLAVGQVVFGHPWFGVWLSTGLMCGAICWMLQGWLPPRWALLGAVVTILRLGVASYWMNTYWGGSVAAAGGALVLGALPRVMRRPDWRHAVTMGAGLAVLANSRPVEGAWFGLGVAAVLFGWMLDKPPGGDSPVLSRVVRAGTGRASLADRRIACPTWATPATRLLLPIVLPLVLVLSLTGGGVAYYFARVTSKPWVAPYVLYRNSMTMAPHFLWQKPTAQPLYNNREMRDFYLYWEMANYFEARQSLWADLSRKAAVYWRFYLGPILTIPLIAVAALWRDRRSRTLLLMAAAFSLVLVGQVWHNAHYAAPATGLAILIVIMAMRRLRLWHWRGQAVGLRLVRLVPMACAAMLLIQMVAGHVGGDVLEQRSWRWPPAGGVARARVREQLRGLGGKHLVFVRYGLKHDLGVEWVYNDAGIDASPVVWARELDRDGNAELIRYFGDRRVWLVEPDAPNPHVVPYAEAPAHLMRFVQLGAPGIRALQSVDQVRSRVLAQAGDSGDGMRTCDMWNFLFAQAIGVAGPDVSEGCYSGDRGELVSFEHWFSWLREQR